LESRPKRPGLIPFFSLLYFFFFFFWQHACADLVFHDVRLISWPMSSWDSISSQQTPGLIPHCMHDTLGHGNIMLFYLLALALGRISMDFGL
jgi:hypothetical protein